jgi:putrescine transport system substrate-binding protein
MTSVSHALRALAIVAISSPAWITCALAGDRVVHVYNWSEFIDQSILEDFTKETGIKVVYDVYESDELLETKLLAGRSGYDVVVPSGPFLSREITSGVFQKLDKSKLPNISNMWPEIEKRMASLDPGNAYSVNYMWGTTAIGYSEAKIRERMPDAPVDSWDLIFKPEIIAKFKGCGVSFVNSPTDILPAALNYLHLDPNNRSADDIAKAFALLQSIRPNIQKFAGFEYIAALADGDICLAVGYSGDIVQARNRARAAKNGQTIVYSLPKEGAQLWFCQMAIPADAADVAEAHVFLNYLMKPEVIAKASNYLSYANGNLASQKLISDEIKSDKSIYPGVDLMNRLYVTTPYDPQTQRMVTRAWTKFVSGE